MKTKFNCSLISILCITLFSFATGFAQEKTKKQIKEEQKLEKQKQIALLIESKEFVFSATRMSPQGARIVNLTSDYTVEYHPDLIKSYLPFAGRGYSGIGYGGDDGMKFEGKPTVYTVEKTKKAYVIKTDVKGKQDSFSMMLTVYFEGSATLSINSNHRSSISYDGDIQVFKKVTNTEK
ncbi:DUF4251 domain-containing protein [Flavobacterium alvei]|uniref:DUF4251 domain-containing protein n=1 Tax=Flavobacterium alvei TaxID=2080416 RepID=UPI0026EDDEB7|nr:DUF4251 domain-containing protein [Flavobacterium alvei]